MNTRPVFFFLFAFAFFLEGTLSAQVSFGKPEKINDGWQFRLGDTPGAQALDFDATGWRILDLPHDWSVEGTLSPSLASCTGYLPGGIGWYRKTLNIPQGNPGDGVYLYFEGVYNRSEVFVNGHSAGKRPSGYVSFMYDITPYVEPGKPAVIAVRVDHSRSADSRWYSGSGIYRNVWMVTAGPVHIAYRGVFCRTQSLARGKAVLTIDTELENQSDAKADLTVMQQLVDSKGMEITKASKKITTTIQIVQEDLREFVRLDIADSGCGIPENEQQSIFERFYQSDNNDSDKTGSGIGLHLVKEYISLHGGRIVVNSKPGKGSVFSIFIPVVDMQISDNNTDNTNTAETGRVETEHAPSLHNEQKTLLIVEDNAELRRFLAEQLSDKFNVLQAEDGKKGLAIAQKKSPDLIVSDLMMPVLNGLEMCQQLKNNIHTSHIPIILLTAKLSDETKIESYKAGADSYIAKPFNFEVLLTRIETLIEQQEKRKKFFQKTIEITPSGITASSLDEELIKKALLAVEKNMDNSEYSVDELASELALSRRQLSRKFRSIIGLSPGEFMRSVRLKRAAQLLKDTKYNISEIAYMVGFSAVKYFNLNFKDEFGTTPSQYRSEGINN